MPRTFRNLIQHEFIGLRCEVVSATNKDNVGVRGKIIDETQKTLVMESGEKKSRIQKKNSIFRITLDDRKIDVDGNVILARPEDRIKKKTRLW